MRFFSILKPAFWISVACYAALFSLAISAQEKEWRPVSPAEISMIKPVVDADADAEAIFWEVKIDDSGSSDLSLRHYVRLKIFTERGREKYSKFDVPFTKGMKIRDVAARVIRPDGSSVEIKKEEIFEREIIKAGGVKIKAKSFAVPNIEPGVIVEYKYREQIDNAGALGMRLPFQRDIPVQRMAYYYKPFTSSPPKTRSYNLSNVEFVKDKDGFWLAERRSVDAFKDEPRMPPDDNVRAWMMVTGASLSYGGSTAFTLVRSIKDPSNPPQYWATVSLEKLPLVKFMLKDSGDIKKVTAAVTAGAFTPDEKLKRIYNYCQTQITNTTFDKSMTDEQRAKLPDIKTLADVLKRKSASSQYIDMLFGAMAHAAGLETRIAFIGDRSRMFITPQMADENLVHPGAIAVKVDDKWRLFNPGVRFLPYGMLVWYEEDTWAMLVGEERYDWVKSPMTQYDSSVMKRDGKFTLSDEGTLEGDVRMEFNGQPAVLYRLENYDETPAKIEEDLKAIMKQRASDAEVTNVSVENLAVSDSSLIQRYHVRIPNYAQRTGKRLFVQPGFFKYGAPPTFSASARKYDVFFRYPWSEADSVEITWPAGFELDNADVPAGISDGKNIGALDVAINVDRASRYMKYERKFHFGGGGNVLFKSTVYSSLKSLFDAFDKADAHTVTLKQK